MEGTLNLRGYSSAEIHELKTDKYIHILNIKKENVSETGSVSILMSSPENREIPVSETL
jgi:hypothetical protein